MNKKTIDENTPDKSTGKRADKGAVPELRFPEFRGTGAWEEKRLGDVAEINPKSLSLPDSFIYIDLECVVSGKLLYEQNLFKNNAPSRAQRLLKDRDILFQCVRPYQKNNFFYEKVDNKNYVASTGYAQIRAKINQCFLYQLVYHRDFVANVLNFCTGTSYPAISPKDLSLIKIHIPPTLAEQEKIAGCLSSLDALITAEERRIKALKKHKKGLMQQLFPAEGECEPLLRFPEFRGTGAWEEKRLGDIAEIFRGGSPRPIAKYITSSTDGFNWLKIGDIPKEGKYIYSTKEKIIQEGVKHSRIVEVNDFILSNSMSFGRPYIMKVKSCIHDGWLTLRFYDKSQIDFLYYFFSSDFVQSFFSAIAQGSSVNNLKKETVEKLIIFLPTPAEQEKIAGCFSSLDALITAQERKIKTLKRHKKGLMQKLFPSE